MWVTSLSCAQFLLFAQSCSKCLLFFFLPGAFSQTLLAPVVGPSTLKAFATVPRIVSTHQMNALCFVHQLFVAVTSSNAITVRVSAEADFATTTTTASTVLTSLIAGLQREAASKSTETPSHHLTI